MSYALFTVAFHTIGFVRLEASLGRGPGVRAELDAAGDRLAALPEDTFPAMRSLARELVAPDLDARFAFGIQMIITGLRDRLPG